MPPRLSGVRVTSVGNSGGKTKPVNPGPSLAPAYAKRMKTSQDVAKQRLRNMKA